MNGLMMNGLMMNGLMMNGLMMNGLIMNGLIMNGLIMARSETPFDTILKNQTRRTMECYESLAVSIKLL